MRALFNSNFGRFFAVGAILALLAVPVVAQGPVEGGGKKLGNWIPGSKQSKPDDPNSKLLSGAVKNANDEPAAGAVVQLKDTKTLQVRSFITKADGTFLFTGLSPTSDYVLKAEGKGMVSGVRNISSFDERKKLSITLKLDTSKADEAKK